MKILKTKKESLGGFISKCDEKIVSRILKKKIICYNFKFIVCKTLQMKAGEKSKLFATSKNSFFSFFFRFENDL